MPHPSAAPSRKGGVSAAGHANSSSTKPSAPPSPKAKVGSAPPGAEAFEGTGQSNTATTPAPAAEAISNPTALKAPPRESLPEFLKPQLATEVEDPPTGEDWLHELKLDGYRMQARKQGNTVQMLTRTGLDWTHRVKPIAAAVQRISAGNAILDGEVVVLDAQGLSSFARLQASFEKGESHPLTYVVFDLLHLNGHNVRNLPLIDRKQMLRELLGEDAEDLRFSDHIPGDGGAVFHKACELHAEGIISKRATAKYSPGRGHAWVKSKCLHEQEFVIGGWKDLSNGQRGIGSLLLGYYDNSGKLIYAGKTGTGFTQKTHRLLRDLLDPLEQKTSPFATVPSEARRNAHFVRPEQVAQVRFATWTAENQLRQAAYLGLREDKPAREVRKEVAAPTPKRDKHSARNETKSDETSTSRGKPDSADLSFRPERSEVEKPDSRRPERSGVEKPASRTSSHAPVPPSSAALSRNGSVSAPRPLRDVGSAASSASAPPSPKAKVGSARSSLPIPPIRLTHPQKIVDPESAVTKEQLAQYLFAVADRMLPHIADRPLSLVRCPEGSSKQCFYQKHVNHMLPPGIGSVMVADKKGGPPEPYITLNSVEALTGLAQMTVLEIHPWGSTNGHLEQPDRIVIDLDPDESLPWSQVAASASEVRERLKKLGIQSFVKTTGGKGIHIVFPMKPEYDFRTMKAWAHGFVVQMERETPRLYLTKMTKAARTGRIYLDYLRNERGATAVAPYSTRSRAGLPVSMPLEWKELKDSERPRFSVTGLPDWGARLKRDPWKDLLTLEQSLSREVVERFAGKL